MKIHKLNTLYLFSENTFCIIKKNHILQKKRPEREMKMFFSFIWYFPFYFLLLPPILYLTDWHSALACIFPKPESSPIDGLIGVPLLEGTDEPEC